jgi:hypothetical protein
LQRKLDQHTPMLDQRLVFFTRLSKCIDFVRKRLWIQVVLILIMFLVFQFYLFFLLNNKNYFTGESSFKFSLLKDSLWLLGYFLIYFIFFRLFQNRKFKLLLIAFIAWFFTLHSYSVYLDCLKFCVQNEQSIKLKAKGQVAVECEVKDSYESDNIFAPIVNGYTLYYSIFEFIMVYAFPLFILFCYLMIKENTKKIEVKRISNKLEMTILNNQISPHFLFNGLNNIYGLLIKNDSTSKEFVTQLQSLFNFSFDNISKEKIPLSDELKYIVNYIELENLRRKIPISVEIENSNIQNLEVAPFLFFTLIENAIKHGFSDELSQSKLDINLSRNGNTIKFKVVNSKSKSVSIRKNIEGGLGLKTLKRRLEILYPNSTLIFKNNLDSYEAEIVLQL